MLIFLRTIEFLGLSVWLGSDIFLSFVVAPGAFQVLSSRDQAGALVGYSLTRMHWMGIACGVVILLCRLFRKRGPGAIFAPVGLCVVLMIALTIVSQTVVTPRMAMLRGKMGSIEATPGGDSLLEDFNKMHQASVGLEGGVLLAGLAAMYLSVRKLSKPAA